MTVVVNIILASICFTAEPGSEKLTCKNALIGADTPRGSYTLQQRLVDDPLYGGDILQFEEDQKDVYAIHRLWLGRPWEKRDKRILSTDPKQRKITKGCVNVTKETYQQLLDCCSTDTLIIK